MRFFPCLSLLVVFVYGVVVSTMPAAWAAEPLDLLSSQMKNGTLPGWTAFYESEQSDVGDVWKLDDKGILSCRGTPRGYICTQEKFADFVLELDWRVPPKKGPLKGGVLIRMTGPDRIWPKSLEAQINSGEAGDFWGLGGYSLQGPPERYTTMTHPDFGTLANLKKIADAEKPRGEWNHYKIVADGSIVTLEINGMMVNRATGCATAPGKICLTAEGNAIEFRNVRLTSLKEQ